MDAIQHSEKYLRSSFEVRAKAPALSNGALGGGAPGTPLPEIYVRNARIGHRSLKASHGMPPVLVLLLLHLGFSLDGHIIKPWAMVV